MAEVKELLLFAKDELKASHFKCGEIECTFTGLSYDLNDDVDGHLKFEGEEDLDNHELEEKRKAQEDKDYFDDLAYSAD